MRRRIEQRSLSEWSATERLSTLAFSFPTDRGFTREYLIERKARRWSDDPVGAILLDEGYRKDDPALDVYMAVRLGTTTTFESAVSVDDRKMLTFWRDGVQIGQLVETHGDAKKPTSWWARLFCGQRAWRIIVNERCAGSVALKYPVSTYKTQLFLRLEDGVELPISLSRRANYKLGGGERMPSTRGLLGAVTGTGPLEALHGDMIIPLNTPRYIGSDYTADIEQMHFLLNIVYRMYYLTGDFTSLP